MGAGLQGVGPSGRLPADATEALFDTGKVAGEALTARVRREDAAAFARLQGRMKSYALAPAEEAAWAKLFTDTAMRLRGATFDAELFDAAVKLALP